VHRARVCLRARSISPLDFLLGEVSAGSAPRNCQVYSGWRHGLGYWKHRGNLPLFFAYCPIIKLLLHSCEWLFPRLFLLRFAIIRPRSCAIRPSASGPFAPAGKSADWPETAPEPFSWANANLMPSWRAYFHVAPGRAALLTAAVAAGRRRARRRPLRCKCYMRNSRRQA